MSSYSLGPLDCRGISLRDASFKQSRFESLVRFDNANFGDVTFEGAEFVGDAYFEGCQATGFNFATAKFHSSGWFQGMRVGAVGFWQAESRDKLYFNGSTFEGHTNIEWVHFEGYTSFKAVTFNGPVKLYTSNFDRVNFDQAKFENDANFRGVNARDMTFERATFQGRMDFRDLNVGGVCSFRSVRSNGDIDLAGARFGKPPDFTISSFRREPRLDSIRIRKSLLGFYTRPQDGVDATERKPPAFGIYIDEHAPAKYREMKKIAASANDSTKELEFHAQEICASRFVTDWPIPWPSKQLSGIARFWFGLAYGALSDFGRSAWRPLGWWMLLIVVSSVLFLGQSVEVRMRRQALSGDHAYAVAYVWGTYEAWREKWPCVAGLPETARRTTNVATEALQLATINAVVFADTGADGARRAYGCLYGLENAAVANSPPIVPPSVSWLGRIQRALSVMLIFLFGLGLRNMLKIR